MKKIIVLMFLLLAPAAWAKDGFDSLISPGELASSHAKYEGISNCTKCHRLGAGVPDANCLDCHTKLARQMQAKQGLHAKYTDACVKCHPDHKGRKYKMISIDKDKFDHDRTDYRLLDKHAKVACNKCHKGTEGIYTGLKKDCASCHDDKHKKQLSLTCERCHNFTGWKDVTKFNHAKDSEYPLAGKHSTVKCEKCHQGGKYKPIAHKACLDCHKDEHKGQFKGRTCESCHRVEGWKTLKFDHNTPDIQYKLEGRHVKVDCNKCHANGKYKPIAHKACIDCHKDEHKGQFKGKTCESCHRVEGWKTTSFNHNAAEVRYRLEGKHTKVECAKCHTNGKYKQLAFKACLDCHKDEHKGQFKGKTCESCHRVEGWKTTSLNHNVPEVRYRLDGKHTKVECAKCHTNGKYKQLAFKACLDCHKDEHKGQFKGKTCESCHKVEGWKTTSFNHNVPEVRYRLDGKHMKVECNKCHTNGKYKPLDYKKCDDCHKDPHKKQFAAKPCEACHVTSAWKTLFFNHNAPQYSAYALDGKHAKTDCSKCHVSGKYKPISSVCLNCHEKDDKHKKELGTVCKKCHTTADWKRSTLDHNLQTKFPLVGRHKDTECSKCHKAKSYKTNAEKCVDCHKDKHKGKFKEECTACHTQFDWHPRKFDHLKKANYELAGVHKDVRCDGCHKTQGEYRKVTRICSQCHQDRHLNQFGSNDCSKCHTQSSWVSNQFRHFNTNYPLAGGHKNADCADCHKNNIYRNTSTVCYNCHMTSYNAAPNHVASGYTQDCAQCHSTTFASWAFRHINTSAGCSTCHMARRPASHVNSPATYPTACETCHISTATWTARRHTSATTGCSTCHLATRPATHVNDPAKYPTTCEACHKYPSWVFVHAAVSSGCSSCHLNSRPASHVSNPATYPTACETCHISTATWTARRHTTATTGCSTCHLATRPASHVNNPAAYPTTCENCHKYPTWTYTHPAVTSGCSSCHLNSRPATHVNNPATYPTTCETCHISTSTWTARKHTSATTGCSTCHINSRPSSHTANTMKYPTTCEICHKYPSWLPATHPATGASCSTCHSAPATHATKNYGPNCEGCHKYPTWTFTHSTSITNCSQCHLSTAPAPHATYAARFGTQCQNCHKYPAWLPATFVHTFSTFPTNHKGYTACSNCHPSQQYGNKGGCIECHRSVGAKVHNSSTNSGCLSCHPYGTK